MNIIYGTDIGKDLIDDLCGSSNSFIIVKSKTSGFNADIFEKAYKIQFLTDPERFYYYNNAEDKSIFDGGSGGTIKWNPSGTKIPTTEGGTINAMIDLAHEMFHAKDANHGRLDDRLEKEIKRNEWQSIYYENILRIQLELPLRTHFFTEEDINGNFIGGSGTYMLDNGLPIKPWWL